MAYELLKAEYPHINIIECIDMPKGLPGIYHDNVILINKHIEYYEKHCVLAEELGHYETTYGDITSLDNIRNIKLEKVARSWGYEKIISFDKLIECYNLGHTTVEDVCLHLEIIPVYLYKAIERYNQRFGLSCTYKGYRIYFDPLNIEKEFF